MKNLILIIFCFLLLSCGGNETETKTDYSNIIFTMDTVVVDPGNEIINLKYGLWSSTITADKDFLYLWNMDESTLDKVNIKELRLDEKIKYEKEGPDGVGSYVAWMNLLDNDHILMASFQGMGLFDLNGKKLRGYKLDKDNFEGDSLEDGESFNRKSIITDDGNIIYGLLGNWTNDNLSFAKVNFQDMVIKKYKLPGIEELIDYSVTMKADQMMMISTTDKSLQRVGDKIILSNSAYAPLFVFDMKQDSVYQVNYTPQLTAAAKKGNYPTEVDSEKRFKEVMAEIYSEINFQAPVWDEVNKRFYRFSYETIPGEIAKEPRPESPEQKTISRVFISIFDEEFNLLGESSVSQLTQIPNFVFVKDGKIWSYVNVDDELGFVRMEFKY
jgi:hypothetical protein